MNVPGLITNTYVLLGLAVLAEVVATTALKASDGFTKLVPSLVVVVGYGVAFWLMSLVLRELPTGVVYAIWSGVGIALITLVAWVWHGQALDAPAVVGLGLIIAGVVVLSALSKVAPH